MKGDFERGALYPFCVIPVGDPTKFRVENLRTGERFGTSYGPTCEVGSGFSDDERSRCAVSDPWVGKIIEVTYLELTKARKLREPAYQGVRFDKKQPDNLLED